MIISEAQIMHTTKHICSRVNSSVSIFFVLKQVSIRIKRKLYQQYDNKIAKLKLKV